MSRELEIKKASLLSYVVIEKFIDFLFFAILLLVVVLVSNADLTGLLWSSALIVGVVSLGLFVYLRFNAFVIGCVGRVLPESLFAKLQNLNSEIREGLHFFRSWQQGFLSTGLFLSGWACIAVLFFLVSWPFVELMELPAYSPLVLVVFSALSLAIPSAPAGIGTMHFGFLLAIELLTGGDYDKDVAAGFIVVLHFLVIFCDFVVGAAILGAHRLVRRGERASS